LSEADNSGQETDLLNAQLHLRHKRTKRQTDSRQESNLMHFSLKMWHLVAIF